MATVVQELVNVIKFFVDPKSNADALSAVEGIADKLGNFAEKGVMAMTLPFIALSTLAAKLYGEQQQRLDMLGGTLSNIQDGIGRSIEDLVRQASTLEASSGVSQGTILDELTNKLLTFANITEAQFDRAQAAIIDFTAATDKEMKSIGANTDLIGEALKDPINGLIKLKEAGLKFNQDALVRNLVDSNRLLDAQKLILTALETQFGGSAAALDKNNIGFNTLVNSGKSLLTLFGQQLLPMVRFITMSASELMNKIAVEMNPTMRQSIIIFAAFAALLPVIAGGLGLLITVGLLASSAVKALQATLLATNTTMLLMLGKMLLWGAVILGIGALLFVLFDDVNNYIKGNESFIGRWLEKWETLYPKIKAYLAPFLILLSDLFDQTKNTFIDLVLFFKAWFEGDSTAMAEYLKKIIAGLFDMLTTLLAIAIPLLIDAVKALVLKGMIPLTDALSKLMINMGKGALNMAVVFIDQIYEAVIAKASGLKDYFMNLSTGVLNSVIEKLNKLPGLNIPTIPVDLMTSIGSAVGLRDNNASSQTLKIDVTADIKVPEGTPQSQQQYLSETADVIFRQRMSNLASQLRSTPGVK